MGQSSVDFVIETLNLNVQFSHFYVTVNEIRIFKNNLGLFRMGTFLETIVTQLQIEIINLQ